MFMFGIPCCCLCYGTLGVGIQCLCLEMKCLDQEVIYPMLEATRVSSRVWLFFVAPDMHQASVHQAHLAAARPSDPRPRREAAILRRSNAQYWP